MGSDGRRRAWGAGAGACCLALVLAACELPKEVDPAVIYGEVTGEADAWRQRPPGLDDPWPSLGTVPPRPDRPDAAVREAISAGLAADRGRSREPLAPRSALNPPAAEASPGMPPMPAAPPSRARLGNAAPIPWSDAAARPPGQPAAAPGAVPPAAPEAAPPALPEPGLAPEAPPPDLLGPPPARPF